MGGYVRKNKKCKIRNAWNQAIEFKGGRGFRGSESYFTECPGRELPRSPLGRRAAR